MSNFAQLVSYGIEVGGRSRLRATITRLKRNRLIRYNAIYLAGSLGAGGLGYVYHFATGRLLGPSQYAVVASAVAALYLITLPALVVQTVSARFTSIAVGRGNTGNIPGLIAQLNLLSLGIAAPIALALVLLSDPLARYLQIADHRVLYVLAGTSVIALLVAATRGALQGMRRFVALSLNSMLDMATRVVSAIGLIVAGLGPIGGVLALVVGPTVAYLQSLTLFRGLKGGLAGERTSLSEVGRYAGLATIGSIGITYLYNADVLLSKHYLLAGAAGIYAAASVLGRVVYFLGLAFAQVMFPEVATLHAKDEPHFHVVDMTLIMLAGVAVFLIAIYAAVPGLVILPFGASFAPVKPYLWPFASALGLLAVSNVIINYFLSIGSARFVVPLVAACIVEPALIVVHHSDPGAILQMVIITMGLLSAALVALYGLDRFPKLIATRIRT